MVHLLFSTFFFFLNSYVDGYLALHIQCCLKCLSSNVEIENKYVRRTPFSVYCLVFSAYVYTYVALYIRRCLK